MRKLRPLIVAVLLLPALIAGCGGSEVEYEQVKAEPPALDVPGDTAALSKGSSTADDAQADETPTPTPTAEGGTGTAAPPAAAAPTTPSTGTGGAAPEAQQPATEEQPENTGGAGADEGLDQFCADNPGACDG